MKKLNSFSYPGKLVEGGEVVPNSPKYAKGHLSLYEPCEVIVYVERRKRDRSKEQNGYYWAVVLTFIAEHTGYSVEELHEIFKSKYLSKKRLWRGTYILTTSSTKELTTNEFAEYLAEIIFEAGELGIAVPPADPTHSFG